MELEGSPHYVYGFCNIDKSPEELERLERDRRYFGGRYDPHRSHTAHAAVVASGGNFSTANLGWLGGEDPCAVLSRLGLADRFHVRPTRFTGFALGNADGDSDLDVWSIDDAKQIEHVLRD